jgi:hypothetical protein
VYDKLLLWLQSSGGPTFYIKGLYQWSVGTWDVMAVHPITENARGGAGGWWLAGMCDCQSERRRATSSFHTTPIALSCASMCAGFGDKDIQAKVLSHNGRVNGMR